MSSKKRASPEKRDEMYKSKKQRFQSLFQESDDENDGYLSDIEQPKKLTLKPIVQKVEMGTMTSPQIDKDIDIIFMDTIMDYDDMLKGVATQTLITDIENVIEDSFKKLSLSDKENDLVPMDISPIKTTFESESENSSGQDSLLKRQLKGVAAGFGYYEDDARHGLVPMSSALPPK